MAHLIKALSSASTSTTSTAAFPTTISNNNYKYGVFMNYCSSDVKKNFASHLYRRLLLRGFRVFMDQQEMHAGDRVISQIEGAIATASVHIAIFSPRYAESIWCLHELQLMLKSGATIIPIFFNVKPSDLRTRTGKNNDGVYVQALRSLEKQRNYDPQTIENWRRALNDVSMISGLELEACQGREGELVERIVQRVEKEFPKPQFHAAKYPTGLDEKLEDFEKTVLLRKQQHRGETKLVGIVGPGGVGKTTLAIEFFNRNRSDYRQSCIAAARELTSFDPEIFNVTEGKGELSSYLASSQALIILDDVDNVEQLDAFFSLGMDVLRSRSLIIVTSRDEDVLRSSGIEKPSIYNLTGLGREHSQELFCLHAFHMRRPVVGFEAAVTKILEACNGMPLSLKVLGALVYQKGLKYWKAPLRRISEVLRTDIQSILQISYDSLDDQEKEMFLDIACFFIKEDRDMVIEIGDASGWEGWLNLENLESKCLVEIDSKNRIIMHDHLRDLGRDLAEKERPSFQRRLWRPTEDLFHNTFQQSTVRGINMVQGRPGSSFDNVPVELSNGFVDMRRLQLLRADGDCLGSISNLLRYSDLLWLCWNSYPYTNLPSWIPIRNLRVLQVTGGKLETLWQTESEAPLKLRKLNIEAAFLRFPKSIGQLGYLEKIEVKAIIEPLPEEFVNLRSLKHLSLRTRMNLQQLDLSGCSHLKMLPGSFGSLINLQYLDLSGCSELQTLPDSLGNLTNLQHLDLSGCSYQRRLPDSLGNLTNLQHLNLSRCPYLDMLPNSFGNLTKLQHLDLSKCSGLEMLPDSFGNLAKLQYLDLSECFRLQTLPDSFGNLTKLPHLNLSKCSHLQTLPDSFGNLTNLPYLDLSGCSRLQMLPESFGNLTNLQHLDLSNCSDLQMLHFP